MNKVTLKLPSELLQSYSSTETEVLSKWKSDYKTDEQTDKQIDGQMLLSSLSNCYEVDI